MTDVDERDEWGADQHDATITVDGNQVPVKANEDFAEVVSCVINRYNISNAAVTVHYEDGTSATNLPKSEAPDDFNGIRSVEIKKKKDNA